MKKLLWAVGLAIALATSAVLAQVSVDRATRHTGNGTGGALDIFNGPMAPPAVDLVNKCIAAVAASAPFGDNQCKLWLKKPCPPAPAASQPGLCPAGTVSTWQQTRTVTIKGAPTCSSVTAWKPASAPAGACTPAPVPTPTTWATVAAEGASFVLVDARVVRFGFNGHGFAPDVWISKSMQPGTHKCSLAEYEPLVDPKPGNAKECQVGSTSAPVVTPPVVTPPVVTPPVVSPPAPDPAGGSANMGFKGPTVNVSLIPTKEALRKIQNPPGGWDRDMLIPTTEVAPPSDIGAFRIGTQVTAFGFHDPIVNQCNDGTSHLHLFLNDVGIDPCGTSLSRGVAANSTSRGGTINRSAYWVPAMIDTKDGAPVVPRGEQNVYYKTGYALPPSVITSMPQGLRMIAGDARGNPAMPSGAAIYACVWDGGNSNWSSSINFDCPIRGRTYIIMGVDFPQCWDGLNLDSPDHKSHMANPVNVKANNTGNCPASHPVAIPQIAYQIIYDLDPKDPLAFKRWRLSSDAYDPAKPAGFSGHGDWFNGWKPEIVDVWRKNCDNAQKDCHSHLLGDGRAMVIP